MDYCLTLEQPGKLVFLPLSFQPPLGLQPSHPPGRGGEVTQWVFFHGRMSKCEGKQLNFNDNFETLEVNFWAVQKLVGLAAAKSCVLSSPSDVSRITGLNFWQK